jgi:hypothetical protein
MDPEDGVIWVYGLGDDHVMAFTDAGIENLIELIKMHKHDPFAAQALELDRISKRVARWMCTERPITVQCNDKLTLFEAPLTKSVSGVVFIVIVVLRPRKSKDIVASKSHGAGSHGVRRSDARI